MSFTTSEENYIKRIYHLQQETGLVNTNSLAAEMHTRPASVTDMLKKLKGKKLLQYEKYKGFKLNEAGKKAALDVVRKHRLWEFSTGIKFTRLLKSWNISAAKNLHKGWIII
jgi:DtxR family transcriptional regulator, Mn-dependent transcriptional regulator